MQNLGERVWGLISIDQAQEDARWRLPLHLPQLSERLLGQGQSSSSLLRSTRVVLMGWQFVLEAQGNVSGNGHVLPALEGFAVGCVSLTSELTGQYKSRTRLTNHLPTFYCPIPLHL